MYGTGGGREYSSRKTDDMQRVFVSESDRVRASQRAKEEEQVRQLACPPRGSGNLTMLWHRGVSSRKIGHYYVL